MDLEQIFQNITLDRYFSGGMPLCGASTVELREILSSHRPYHFVVGFRFHILRRGDLHMGLEEELHQMGLSVRQVSGNDCPIHQ